MTDSAFYKLSIQIFVSVAYKKELTNLEAFNDDFWNCAAGKIDHALNNNPQIIKLLKLVYINENISEDK